MLHIDLRYLNTSCQTVVFKCFEGMGVLSDRNSEGANQNNIDILIERYFTVVRKDGIAVDNEAYIDGVVAFAFPLKAHQPGLQAAVWAVGLEQQVNKSDVPNITEFVKKSGR